jgi:hypothetical protein
MPRRLLALNVVLVGVAALCVLSIVRTLTVRTPDVTVRPRPIAPAAAATRMPEPPPNPAAYTVIAARNLFSPTRTEAPPTTTPTTAAARQPKPLLFGIVLRDGQPIAYLEDPSTKRVAGYRVGDSVAGGTLQKIAADRVVVNRPEGAVDVRLHDPSKPRPAPPVPAAPPGAIVPKPAVPGAPPSPYPGAVSPPALVPRPGVIPQRPLPPNLLRRIPPGPPPVAPPPPDVRR